MSKKYKTVSSPQKGDLFKVPKSLYETLNEDSTDYKLLLRDVLTGAKITREAERAALDLMEKVRGVKNQEAKKFWIDRVEALMRVIGLNSQMRDRFLLVQSEYNNLYNLTSDLQDRVKELEEKLLKYEKI